MEIPMELPMELPMEIPMELPMSMSMISIKTITYRGIVCIDTFPLELVWCKLNTALECNNCLAYATYKNVLVGLCINCAGSYNGKYGSGFYTYPYRDSSDDEISYCFGNIHPLHIINIKGLEYPQTALNSNDSYTIYNLSLSSKNELNLLLQIPFNIYGLYELQNYYNCDIEVLYTIIEKIKEHKLTFNIWNMNYYTKCLELEKNYKKSKEDYKIENEIFDIIVKPKYPCSYCNIYKYKKELKKCQGCNIPRYCSIACQTREWNTKHKLECAQEQEHDFLNPVRIVYEDEDEDVDVYETSTDTSNDTSNVTFDISISDIDIVD